ncbi:MAG: hypothetical protein A4E71_00046 [Smithella sp. PtaU1.Bin162]|nr:MAG: hypothetical protein A4E71_00046 [Smithella sp. PtaU1.Bin162]
MATAANSFFTGRIKKSTKGVNLNKSGQLLDKKCSMKNVEMKLDGDILTIKIDVTKEFGPSASGKTIIIASTEGNISIPEKDDVKIGLNVYKKKQ